MRFILILPFLMISTAAFSQAANTAADAAWQARKEQLKERKQQLHDTAKEHRANNVLQHKEQLQEKKQQLRGTAEEKKQELKVRRQQKVQDRNEQIKGRVETKRKALQDYRAAPPPPAAAPAQQ